MSNIHPIIFTLVWPSFPNSIDLSLLLVCLRRQRYEKANLNFCAVVFYHCDISVRLWVIQMNVYRRECNSFKIMSFYFNLLLHNFKSFWNVTDISHALQCAASISVYYCFSNKRFLFVSPPSSPSALSCHSFFIPSNTASASMNRHTHYKLTVNRRAMNKSLQTFII